MLLAHGPGVPTPEEVVQGARHGDLLPRERGVGSPQSVRFALTRRPTGPAREELLVQPDSPRARLERYVIMTFPAGANLEAIETALLRNPHVLHVERNQLFRLHVSPNDPLFPVNGSPPNYQWGSHLQNLPGAWDYAKGHSYLGLIDTGLEVDHPDLRAFNGSTYVGGNFRPHMSWDLTWPASCQTNQDDCVDEMEEGGFNCSDPGGVCVGHGTHTSGIMAATGNNGTGVAGACWNCSLLMTRGETLSDEEVGNGITWLVEHGVQALSMSFGYQFSCAPPNEEDFICTALDLAERREVLMTASPGNDKRDIEFPASDPRVLSVGGIESSGAFWDRADEGGCPCALFPGIFSSCGSVPTMECGSNYTVTPGSAQQDLVAPAKEVLSTFYHNMTWNRRLGCHDLTVNGVNHAGAGYDLCTGTSMSSPYVAAIAGILRSVNPLLTKAQIESALKAHASLSGSWSPQLGYGVPDAGASVQAVLGQVNGQVLANRLTPLFPLYSSVAEDHFYTTFPQMGAAAYWSSDGYAPITPTWGAWPDVRGYGYFPDAGCNVGPCLPEPGASVYVFATDRSPNGHPLVPLYRMSFEGTFTGGPSNPDNRDTSYTTDTAGIGSFTNAGYKLDGIEGYIYQRCTPEPACIPAGAVRLYQRYNAARDDHAIFPESELAAMVADGYTQISGNQWIGYAYPNLDSDADDVIDGFEALLGTDPQRADSDCDYLADGAEILGYPTSDPRGSPPDLHLSNQTISTTRAFHACNTITADNDFVVASGGNVTLHAVAQVALGAGFKVSPGGQLKVVVP